MTLPSSNDPSYNAPLFEHMAHMNDEAVWDLLVLLYGLIDAYEAHYAEPLQRLRLARYQQLHESGDAHQQMELPITDPLNDPF